MLLHGYPFPYLFPSDCQSVCQAAVKIILAQRLDGPGSGEPLALNPAAIAEGLSEGTSPPEAKGGNAIVQGLWTLRPSHLFRVYTHPEIGWVEPLHII
jgi:hypothetical protein